MKFISRKILSFPILLFPILFFFCNSSSRSEIKQDKIGSEKKCLGSFILPMQISPNLSGNFGELRNNHFHSGIDFKTEKRVGIPIYSVCEGWISRIRVSAYGFGYALYISHPNGFTSVYGHLDRYAYPFDSICKGMQYKTENFELDTLLKKGKFPVSKNQLIAYSGNSGSSSAPHLHFEIRNSETEETIDPLNWYSDLIPDKKQPSIREISVYAISNVGVLDGGFKKKSSPVLVNTNGIWILKNTLPDVWGKIGFGIKAYDLMDNNTNLYGVKKISLYHDNIKIYCHEINIFAFDQTRYVNSFIDYEAWKRSGSFVMKSFIEPGNNLSFYEKYPLNGYVDINEERVYNFRYVLSDNAGNSSEISFAVKGKKTPIPEEKSNGYKMTSWKPNQFKRNNFELFIPVGNLYKDLDFMYNEESSTFYSNIFHLHDEYVPLHKNVKARFRLNTDTLTQRNSYYLAKKSSSGAYQYVGGKYDNGWISADIREFGTYTVKADLVSPKITPLNLESSPKNRLFRIRITDDASGIKYWRGTIDGKWVLFSYNIKASRLEYSFDDTRLQKNSEHILQLIVVDACGNKSDFEYKFHY